MIDPQALRLTHLAVRPRGLLPAAHLYRLEDLSLTADALRVTGPAAASGPTRDNEITFVPIGGWPYAQESYDVGIVHVVGWPRTALGGSSRPRWTADDLDMVVDFDRLPKGHVELDGTSEVYDRSRHLVGHLQSVTADETGALHGLRVRHSVLWVPHALDVPATSIKRIVNDEVWLHTSRYKLPLPSRGVREEQVASRRTRWFKAAPQRVVRSTPPSRCASRRTPAPAARTAIPAELASTRARHSKPFPTPSGPCPGGTRVNPS